MSCVEVCEEAEIRPLQSLLAEERPAEKGPSFDYARVIKEAGEESKISRDAEWKIKVAIVVAATLALIVALASGKLHAYYSLFTYSRLALIFWWTAAAYGVVNYCTLVWRIILWRRYRPMDDLPDAQLPTVSVIIPAFNEGPLVRLSILSAAANNYPAEKLEIIAVDDGSTDDTWVHIQAAAEEVDPLIKISIHRQPRNMGKREALYLGFTKGKGDVFVTMDSDSVLHRDAIRNGVVPIVRDPSIANVAGCVEVLNPRQSWVTRFLKCTFSLSFKFVRAYQSEFRGVFCSPGALSVYRADVVRKVADEWVTQKFLGLPCSIGEDRAMTTLILREGWMTAYQGSARVCTQVPHTYVGLCKMLLRWGRSNVRETIVMMRFLFSRFRNRYLLRFQFNMLLTIISLFLPPIVIFNGYMLLLTDSDYALHALGLVMINAFFTSIVYYINEKDSDWVWLFAYEFFWTAALSWIIPWSVITVRNVSWLTRGGPAKGGSKAKPARLPALLTPGDSPILQPAMASPSR